MKTAEQPQHLNKFSKIGVLIPAVLLLAGIILIFASDFIVHKKEEENFDAMENRIASMIDDLSGVSDSEVILLTNENGTVSGAAVVCIGGDLSENKKNIIELITSLFGVGASDVFVGGK